MTWNETLELYDKLVAITPGFERKGKTVPYTSSNGYMFSLLNKDGELGIRLPKDEYKKFIEEFDSSEFRSHGAVMRSYVLVPDKMLEDLSFLAPYLLKAFEYVNSLKPKSTKKK